MLRLLCLWFCLHLVLLFVQLYTAGPEQKTPALCWPQCDLLSESGIELVSEELVDVMVLMEGLIP